MDRILLIGPWVGEFGWEQIRFSARCRKYAKGNRSKFKKIIVSTIKGHDLLYKDFADEIIYNNPGKNCECWMTRRLGNPKFSEEEYDKIRNENGGAKVKVEWFQPTKITTALNFEDQEFIPFGIKEKKKKYDLVIHARWCNKRRTHNRDWSVQKWVAVTDYFKNKLRMVSIGTIKNSKHIAHTENKLGVSLEQLADIMVNSKLVIGPSSGPMHFASLCGVQHLVWTDARRWGGARGNNRHRYEKSWNPFHTSCRVLDDCNWNPQVSVVIRNIKEMLGML